MGLTTIWLYLGDKIYWKSLYNTIIYTVGLYHGETGAGTSAGSYPEPEVQGKGIFQDRASYSLGIARNGGGHYLEMDV